MGIFITPLWSEYIVSADQGGIFMDHFNVYSDIQARTGGEIYIGVVGPVRTGKSTFIKRFMELLVLPGLEDVHARERARDELPQSSAGKTIMTTEPKFIPKEAVQITLGDGIQAKVRLIDCVGYMVDGAAGHVENGEERMVKTPWFDHEIPMTEAAEIGTRKVITDHATVGVVVTTDGTITDIPREDYREAEERVIRELQDIGKPFVVLVNSAQPEDPRAAAAAAEIQTRYGVTCRCVNCLTLTEDDIGDILRDLLYQFPLRELDVFLPEWVDALPGEHPIRSGLYQEIGEAASQLTRICALPPCLTALSQGENIESAAASTIDLGSGVAQVEIRLPRRLFFETLSQRSGLQVTDDGDLMQIIGELAEAKREYDKVAPALRSARETGYGIVMPGVEELNLEDPEIVRQGGRYGVRMRASAPSIHLIRADIETTVSPIVGNEKQSEDMVNYLLQEFEGDTGKLWQSNIFGRSFHEIVGEDLQAKLKRMPADAQAKLRQALERIINEGGGGLICIIL